MSSLNRLLVLTMVLSVVGIAHAQPPALQVRSRSDALQLLLKPEDLPEQVPGSFTFLLVNRSDHDIRLPRPDAPCRNSVHGFINLVLRFTPAPGGKGTGSRARSASPMEPDGRRDFARVRFLGRASSGRTPCQSASRDGHTRPRRARERMNLRPSIFLLCFHRRNKSSYKKRELIFPGGF